MSTQRRALIIANDEYEHQGLGRLLAPSADARALSAVLGDERIGDFDVKVIRNEPAYVISEHIEDLFSTARSADVLLLHMSCHGLKSESGELFFAAANTRPERLGSTAVSADFVQRCMRTSRARSVVLLLDCCYGGAFAQGVTVRAAGDVDVLGSFPRERLPSGRGRAVITASSAMEYAFEGDQLADDAQSRPSVFTAALVEGLATGDADRNQDGWVSLDELYDYVFDKVRERSPHQTPSRDVEMQGDLYIARRSRPVTAPSPLPPELAQAVESSLAGIRVGAVQELERVLRGGHAGRALAARRALEDLTHDDSRSVSAAAAAALASVPLVSSASPATSEPAGDEPPEPGAPSEPAEPAGASVAAGAPAGPGAASEAASGRHEPAIPVPASEAPEPAPPEPELSATPAEPALPDPAATTTALAETALAETALAESEPGPAGEVPSTTEAPRAADSVAAPPARPRQSPGPSWLLVSAGVLSLAVAVLTVTSLYVTFAPDYRLLSYSTSVEQTLVSSAISVAAGICLLVPWTSRRIGSGLGLGSAATLPADAAAIRLSLKISSPPGPGAWLVIVALILVLAAVALIAVHLARTREIRVELRYLIVGPALAWLIILLGAAGAAAYAADLAGRHDFVGFGSVYVTNDLIIALVWITLMALVIPFLAVTARPRSFGVALAAGWVGAGLAEVIFLTGLRTSVFAYTLLAITVLLVPLARTTPATEVTMGGPTAAS
jgi:uncharacterized membrane protein